MHTAPGRTSETPAPPPAFWLGLRSWIRPFVVTFLLVFGCEFIVMMALPFLDFEEGLTMSIVDSGLLSLLVIPGMLALGLLKGDQTDANSFEGDRPSSGSEKTFWGRLFCLRNQYIVILITLAVVPLLWLGGTINRKVSRDIRQDAVASAHALLEPISQDLQRELEAYQNDTRNIALYPPITGLLRSGDAGGIDPIDGSTEGQWRHRLESLFSAHLASHHDTDHVRFIDEKGLERVRVSSENGTPRIYKPSELQDKSQRYYFKDTMGLREGECYVSPLDLNVEHGVIEVPHNPMLRIATPVWMDGRPRGIIILNVSPHSLLANLHLEALGSTILANEKGIYLHHPDQSRQWADQLGGDANLNVDWPALFSELNSPSENNPTQQRGEEFGIDHTLVWTSIPLDPGDPERYWLLGYQLDNALLFKTENQLQEVVLGTGILVGAIALIMALVMAMVWGRPVARLAAAANRLSEGDFQVRVPVNRHDELGDMGRAFNHMAETIENTTAQLEQDVHIGSVSLAEQEAKNHTIINTALDGVITMSSEGKITGWNPHAESIFGWTEEEALGCLLSETIIPPKYRAAHQQGILHYLETGEGKVLDQRIEITALRKNGEEFSIELSITPIITSGAVSFSAFARDITEKKQYDAKITQALEEAKNSNRAKSDFLANMSHEIRTPMTAILGYTDLLLDPAHDAADFEQTVSTIKRNGEHLLTVINDILDISKLEAGKMEVERLECSPLDIASEVVDLLKVRAEGKGLSLAIETVGPIPCTILSDPTRLRQILVNLMGNAIKFTEIGGVRLVISCVDDGPESFFQCEVIDTGIGMTEAQVDGLFQAFTQGDTSTTRKFGGTGLGLVISKRLTELLGGTLTVQSKPGEGSRLRMRFPTGPLASVRMLNDATVASGMKPKVAPPTQPEADTLACRILFAEDGPDNQRLVGFILKKAGAEVTIVENGKLALDAALQARDEGTPFSVILMDMQMPVMDGYEATGMLREKGYTGPIVALTAHAMAGDRQKCLDAGCDDYQTKPIDRKKLIACVTRYAGMHTTPSLPAG